MTSPAVTSPAVTSPAGQGERRAYITTPIYYVNDAPHLGHAYTTVVADALARFSRLAGKETLFATGTDEHGLKVQRAAEAAGCGPQAWADRTAARFVHAWAALGISNDDFVRTTEERHLRAVEQFLQAVYDNGDIELGTYEGSYCVACEAYYTEAEAPDGRCPVHHKALEALSEENYFFRLSRYEKALLRHYEANPGFVQPASKAREALGTIKTGLRDFSVSRTSITWGVPIPWDRRHVAYVWFDALVNYLTVAGYGSDEERFRRWWPASHHLVGKDILRFHCVYWPAMLMAAGIEPPGRVSVHGYLLVGGEKMAKTGLNQISPLSLADEFGADGLRYALLKDHPFGPDGDFSYEALAATYNSDLANTLGNLLSRVTALVLAKCGGTCPEPPEDGRLAEAAAEVAPAAARAWSQLQPAVALKTTWRLLREADALLDSTEPWRLEPGHAVDEVLGACAEALRLASLLAYPAIPGSASEIWRRLGLSADLSRCSLDPDGRWAGASCGRIIAGPPLFPRHTGPAR